jgi:CHAT domain-containing protein
VIVGDPTGDLPAAAAEAWALLSTHYPRGAYLGTAAAQTREDSSHLPPGATPTTPVGRGTPEEVLARLPGGALDDGPPVYHLACHGQVATSPSASRLTLADGRRLTVDDILSQARRPRRPAGGPVVTLAACTSSLTEREHDEALTFATAFLVAGAATAVGALWQVSDRLTSTFMLALHHFIATRRPGDGCGDAVRRAQLWMLDPARVPLPGMSEDVHGRATWGNLTHPVAWAGFVHAGR